MRKQVFTACALALVAPCLHSVAAPLPQTGPAFTVTTTDSHQDNNCTTDDCTLADAISAAEANADANTIFFAPGVSGVITVPQPNGFVITKPVSMRGPGARQLTIDGGSTAPILVINGAAVSISGVTLNGGRSQNNGGAISNSGSLTVTDCTISNSSGPGSGGGLFNAAGAAATVERSTFVGNTAEGLGGGGVFNSGTFTAINCTFNGNTAVTGGAIYSAANNGNSLATLRSCTIAFNTSTSHAVPGGGGGGYYGEGAAGNTQHHFANCILSNNSSDTNPDFAGYGTSDGTNIIRNLGQTGSGFTNGVNGDKVGVSGQLNFFQNNGGPTDTFALQTTSPAINAGNANLAPVTDQRGYLRSGLPDIGAFEFNGSVPPPVSLTSAVSRKTHTGAGAFDINLPLAGGGVECRGATGNHTLVLTFANTLASAGNLMVTGGTARISNGQLGADAHQYVIDLAGVANAQTVSVTLTNVMDSAGNYSSTQPLSFGVLLGDANGDGNVNSGDATITRNRSGQDTSAANFRADYNTDGSINAADATIVRGRSGTFIP